MLYINNYSIENLNKNAINYANYKSDFNCLNKTIISCTIHIYQQSKLVTQWATDNIK